MMIPKFLRWALPPMTLGIIMDNEAPDTSRQDAVAEKIQGLNEKQFAWVQQKYDEQAPDRAAASARANKVSDKQIEQMDLMTGLAKESAQDYRTIYRPQEVKAAQYADDYNTEAKREELAGKAKADVEQGFADAQQIANRNMTRAGVNPGDPAYAAASAGLQRDHALALTYGANKARTDAETLGRALRSDVIATGRGVIGTQGTQVGTSISAGNAAAANGITPVTVGQAGVGMVQQAAGQATSGLGAAANIFTNSSRMQADAAQASSAGIGSLAGAGMTAAAMF